MMQSFQSFAAAAEGPAIHVAPGVLFEVAGIGITNSMLFGWISAIFIISLLVYVAGKATVKPQGGVVQFVEVGAEFIHNLVVNSFNDKSKGRKYVPFFATIFFFILLNNWLGLLPGTAEALAIGDDPLFRAFTADLNGTLAIGAVMMATIYGISIKELGGFRKYLRHFFIGSPLNPLYFFIGLLEMFTDLTRVFSLSLRLFLNVTIGEIIIAVFTYLGGFLAPATALPFTIIELFVGALQAYIFTLLGLMYLSISVNHGNDHADEHLTEGTTADTIGAKAIA